MSKAKFVELLLKEGKGMSEIVEALLEGNSEIKPMKDQKNGKIFAAMLVRKIMKKLK